MRTVFSIMGMEFKQYRRTLLIWISLIILTVYLAAGYYYFISELMQVGQFLQSSGYIVMASALFGLFFGILTARREQDANFAESLMSIPGDSLRNLSKLLAWCIVCILIMIFASVEVLLITWFNGSEYLFFSREIIIYIFQYWGFTLFSSGILGFAIEKLFGNSWWKFPIILFFWFIISPYNIIFAEFVPINVLSWINQGERDIASTYNGIEGLYIGGPSLTKKIAFFAICLTFAISTILIKSEREKSIKEIRFLRVGFMFFFIVFLVFAFGVKSPLDAYKAPFNNYTEFYLNQDAEYYSNMENTRADTTKPSFRVKSYDIKLKQNLSEIDYTAKLIINDVNLSSKMINFTLFHDLEITQIIINGENSHWKRDGDWLYVDWPQGKSEGEILLKIKGSVGAFNQISETSFLLSSTFPWYPIPGTFVVAEKTNLSYEPQYNNLEPSNPSYFKISVQSNNKVFSNLIQTSDNTFEGNTLGPTLLSGTLMKKETGAYSIVGPPDRIDKIASSIKKLNLALGKVSKLIDVNSSNLPSMIFVVPSFSYSSNNFLVLGEDQLFVNELITRNPYTIDNIAGYDTVFHAFFWSNSYRVDDVQSSFVFKMIFQYLQVTNKQHTVLTTQAKEIQRLGNKANPISYLAFDIVNLYEKKGDASLMILAKEAYEISHKKTLELSDWKKLIEKIQ